MVINARPNGQNEQAPLLLVFSCFFFSWFYNFIWELDQMQPASCIEQAMRNWSNSHSKPSIIAELAISSNDTGSNIILGNFYQRQIPLLRKSNNLNFIANTWHHIPATRPSRWSNTAVADLFTFCIYGLRSSYFLPGARKRQISQSQKHWHVTSFDCLPFPVGVVLLLSGQVTYL